MDKTKPAQLLICYIKIMLTFADYLRQCCVVACRSVAFIYNVNIAVIVYCPQVGQPLGSGSDVVT